MEKTMTMIIDESEELAAELLSLIDTIVKNDNRIASPVCWQLGEKVLMNYDVKLKPNLPHMRQDMSIALYDYSKMVNAALENEIMVAKDTIPYTTHKIKLECPETLKVCQDASRHTVSILDINSKDNEKHEKKSHTSKRNHKRNNSPWRKQVLYGDGDEELLNLNLEQWKFV
ncbi:hypothetical protein L1987_53227 [Smallanthus sonchifolius]|uniref:Uncharacterized protein n=1 Tax=Smallanthus sonchifolius TaxID=185202 RepID=A0ACB9EVR7_9ASTR|nr:hypothetical protein L1987_53227 [Smallanthus sonchifolius]